MTTINTAQNTTTPPVTVEPITVGLDGSQTQAGTAAPAVLSSKVNGNLSELVLSPEVLKQIQQNGQVGAPNPGLEMPIVIDDLSLQSGRSRRDGVPPAMDKWLKDNGFNRYGDPIGTNYFGANPLIHPITGKMTSRLECIMRKHPYLAIFQPGHNGGFPGNGWPPFPSFPSMPTTPPNFGNIQQIIQYLLGLISNIGGGNQFPVFGTPGAWFQKYERHQRVSQQLSDVREQIKDMRAAGYRVPLRLIIKERSLARVEAKLRRELGLDQRFEPLGQSGQGNDFRMGQAVPVPKQNISSAQSDTSATDLK